MSTKKKSGIRKLEPNEILFHDEEQAESLYIIQKGQLRLFKPKGKGYVELAILRAGEVVGEMAYFDKGKGRKRSCSAQSIVPTEIIEVSFSAFGKTIEGLNPWFKAIFETLAQRLRKANVKVKELESNSVLKGYGQESADYTFLQHKDVVRILSMIYLVFKSHGEESTSGVSLHMNTLNFYAKDIFNVQEIKLVEFSNILKNLEIALFTKDDNDFPKVFVIKDLDRIRQLMIFFNTQRITADEKQMKISAKCETFLEEILKEVAKQNLEGELVQCNISPILNDFSNRNIQIDVDDLADARKNAFVGAAVVDDGNISLPVKIDHLRANILNIRMMSFIEKLNRDKR